MVNEPGEDPTPERTAPAAPPRFEVLAGHPSGEEIAALTVALAATMARGARPAAPPPDRGNWADPSRMLHLPPRPGPGAWRRSALSR